jgi:hypothetical protein
MNRKIGAIASLINVVAVVGFAVSMIVANTYASYLCSIFISLSFVPMMCAFCYYSGTEVKLAGYVAVGFAAIYAALILLVYYAQITTVHSGGLTAQAASILDFSRFGLLFNYDMLGYALMSLSTFFAGLTVLKDTRASKCLRVLLLVHGIFFISCFILPLAGLFTPDLEGAEWIGTAILTFWCGYFTPIGILSFVYFKRQKT